MKDNSRTRYTQIKKKTITWILDTGSRYPIHGPRSLLLLNTLRLRLMALDWTVSPYVNAFVEILFLYFVYTFVL